MQSQLERPLKVCVYGAARESCLLLLYSLAQGDVLGNDQCLQITLQDKEDKSDELMSMAEDLQDACYPLVTGIQSECNTFQCLPTSDFIFLLLDHDDVNDTMQAVQKYAAEFRVTSGIKFKTVALISNKATLAAAALMLLCPDLNSNLLISVNLPKQSTVAYCQLSGTYQMVQSVCQAVKSWLTTRSVSVRQDHTKDIARHCLLSLPEQIPPTLPASLYRIMSPDWEKINSLVEEMTTVCNILHLPKSVMVTSSLDAKL